MIEPEMVFGNLSEFVNKSVTLYKSSDPKLTSIYFTNDTNKRENIACFELLVFEYNRGESTHFLKYPNQNHFIELSGTCIGSARGNMTQGLGENVWENFSNDPKYRKGKIQIYQHDGNVMLNFDDSEFNFLKIAARKTTGEKSYIFKDSSYGQNRNIEMIESVLKEKYLKLPENVRGISYMCKTKDMIGVVYFAVDYPAYNFSYDNQRFRVILSNNDIKELKVTKMERYRDGGTTYIFLLDGNNKEHIFFSPSSFVNEEIEPTNFDGIPLINVTDEERKELCKVLNILIIPNKE